MVTLLGFFFIIGNIGLLSLMDPDLTGPKSPWVCYSYALGVWMYSTMDNIDGKQARRTGTSSGLGELFDHGIDSLNCTLASLLMTSAMGLGATPIGAFTAIVPTLPMYFSTWETYHTHTLFLGYFNGPTEGLVMAALFMASAGYYGPPEWEQPLADIVGFSGLLGSLTVQTAWIAMILSTFFIGHLPSCVYNVVHARRQANFPLLPVFLQWTPMLLFCGCLTVWLGSPYSHLLSDNHLCLLCLTLSFVFGRMTTKTILAHLTRQPYPYWTALLAPLIGGAVLVNLPLLNFSPVSPDIEHYYLWAYFLLSAVVYFRWAFVVCRSICTYLGINCLTIPDEKRKALERQQQQDQKQKQKQ